MTSPSTSPRVSVAMSVYNGAAYLHEAIESILAQTFSDFEFIIIDDASTDETSTIIKSYDDSRIVLLHNENNEGLALSLNRAIDVARGTYLARMDADDISMPNRLKEQVRFLDEHPDIVLVGAYAQILDSSVVMRQPTQPGDIAVNLLFRTSLIHPTAVFRRNFLEQYHLRYDPVFRQTQDYELFTRIARLGKIANIPSVLLRYRQHDKQTSSEKLANQLESARTIMRREFEMLSIHVSEEEIDVAIAVKRYRLNKIPDALERLEVLLMKIELGNQNVCRYDATVLHRTLGEVWLESAISLSRSGIEVRSTFLLGTPRAWIIVTPRNIFRTLRFLLRGATN